MSSKHRIGPRPSFWMALVAFFAAATLAAPAAFGQPALQEGKQYVRLKNPQLVETGNKIEVIEFFSYGCPHCASLEPELERWLKTLPPDVQFRRVPVLFQAKWVNLAKVYYTLDALGVEPKLTPDVFTALHSQGIDLSNEKTFLDWAAGKGLDRKKVEEMYASFGINGKVNRAKQQGAAYNIQGVPSVVVDGKFETGSEKVGTMAALPPVITALIDKARAERGKH